MDSGLSDLELVLQAQEKSDKAFQILFKRYKSFLDSRVKNYFLMGADEEDVRQECRIGFYKAICNYRNDGKRSFRGFADLCIRRHVVTAVKAASRFKHRPLYGYTSIPIHKIDSCLKGSSPLRALLVKEKLKGMKSIFHNLTSLEKSVFLLNNQGFSYKDIARKMKISERAVDNALRRARKKFKYYLINFTAEFN